MNVQKRLSLQTIVLLACGILASVAVSYTAQLVTARFAAVGWLGSSLTDGLPTVNAAELETLSAESREISQHPEIRRGTDPEAVTAVMNGEFADPHSFWAVVDERTQGPISRPGCARAVRRIAGRTAPQVLACDGVAVLALYTPVVGARWRGLVIGTLLDERYADYLSTLFNTEVTIYVGDEAAATSLRNAAGGRIRVPAPQTTTGAEPSFGQHALTIPGYRVFTMGHRSMPVGEGDEWYFSGSRLGDEGRVVVAFLVPVRYMTQGAWYGVMITSAFALVICAAMALLVWRMVHRFLHPVHALSASARAVAGGDLTVKVPVPADAEMGGLCETYNRMLDSMQDTMATRTAYARSAGMSEVATGVLHNVGNVLNSVNVSASLSLDCADRLRLASLDRAVALFEEAGDDLGRFLTEDERGRKMPAFLRKLSDQLASERARLRDELRLLVERVECIKGIVAAQQQFAKAGAAPERCHLADLVDAAVKLEATALQRHDVELTCDVPAGLALVVDRHRVIHLLVNLIANAKQATSSMPSLRRIDVQAREADDGTVSLSVADNGVGIAPDDLRRIFSYGYTTRKDGHGFGLHHSALSATEMGGRLAVHSEGHGRGAVFTVTLPLADRRST